MYHANLSLVIEEGHPAFEWAKKQSDSVHAFGHIGTHIDCYESTPEKRAYEVSSVVIDCTEKMPSVEGIESQCLSGKALVLFTGNVERNRYGTPAYGAMATSLDREVLDTILRQSPAFIVIDSYGIGAHGEEHIRFDKTCEANGCFVIENVNLSQNHIHSLKKLRISFDRLADSTGKRCDVQGLCV